MGVSLQITVETKEKRHLFLMLYSNRLLFRLHLSSLDKTQKKILVYQRLKSETLEDQNYYRLIFSMKNMNHFTYSNDSSLGGSILEAFLELPQLLT